MWQWNMMKKDVPRRYGLSWIADSAQLVVKIHADFADRIPIVSPTAPIVQMLQKEFELKGFVGDMRQNFGFENALRAGSEKDGFISLSVPIPVIDIITDEPCDECGGSGFADPELWDKGTQCLYCDGKKRKSFLDWHTAHAISASLNTLFCVLLVDVEGMPVSFSAPPQLLTVELAMVRTSGGSGYPLGGYYSKTLARWLSSGGVRLIPAMSTAMRCAYVRMFGPGSKYGFDSFRASVDYDTGWLNANCPGQACGINPECPHVKSGEGYRFGSHNVDSPMQQLTLLAGLAALHDCVDS